MGIRPGHVCCQDRNILTESYKSPSSPSTMDHARARGPVSSSHAGRGPKLSTQALETRGGGDHGKATNVRRRRDDSIQVVGVSGDEAAV